MFKKVKERRNVTIDVYRLLRRVKRSVKKVKGDRITLRETEKG